MIIRLNRNWLKVDDWTGRAEHTDLLPLFVPRDLISTYWQTVLGPQLISRAGSRGGFTLVFGRVVKVI